MALILNPTFPDRRPRRQAAFTVSFERTGRAAKRRAQLARKRERQRAAQPGLPHLVFAPSGAVVECNDAAVRLFGLADPKRALLSGLIGGGAARELLSLVRRGDWDHTPIELTATLADGSDRWLRLIVSVSRVGALRSCSALVEDLTALRRTEQVADVLALATGTLASAPSAQTGVIRVVRALVERLRMDFAAVWCVDPRTNTLRYEAGAPAHTAVAPFDQACRTTRFERGIGLPGRVWSSGSAAFIPDVATDDNFPRVREARSAGLRTGLAVPIRRGGRTIGAIEMFTSSRQAPDPGFLRRLAGLGDLIGLFLDPEQPGCCGNDA